MNDTFARPLQRTFRRFVSLTLANSMLVVLAGTIFAQEPAAVANWKPTIVAHRGASGYLPEHTREATAMAHALGADFIEQDLVCSRDGVLVVLHDIHLDTVTDVATRFPKRHRDDGRWYAIDFDWGELQQLAVHERMELDTKQPAFPARYPVTERGQDRPGGGPSGFRIATFQEMITLIQGMNRSTGRVAGIYPEIKSPSWHRQQGQDISQLVVQQLANNGYTQPDAPVFLQCFEAQELRRIHDEMGCKLRKVQLLGGSAEHDQLASVEGLKRVATYATGVGPSLSRIIQTDNQNSPGVTDFVKHAHQAGLLVHPYTVRKDALPSGIDSYHRLLELCREAAVDGFFTDFPGYKPRQ